MEPRRARHAVPERAEALQRGDGRPFQRSRLRQDAGFRIEIAYCYEHGIPYSEYLERWDNIDRSRVIAHAMEESERCSSCGTSEWEWKADRFAYMPVRQVCHGCQAKDLMREDEQDQAPPGSSVVLLPRAAADRLLEEQAAAQARRSRRQESMA